jgi:delta-aminolevulinic acid dehydratase/porphobilinogen synthase
MRRLRKSGLLRGLVRETELSASHLVYPMFVRHGIDGRVSIASMPGVDHLSITAAVEEAGEAAALGIPVYTTYGGRLGGVDEALIRSARMRPLTDPRALDLVKRSDGHTERVRRDPGKLVDLMLEAAA